MLTASTLRHFLRYYPSTGKFRRLQASRNGLSRKGDLAGVVRKDGYVMVSLNGVKYLAHRLAFLYMTGRWPTRLVDHRNQNPSDNRWRNLRHAGKALNMQNSKVPAHNTSGYKGVSFHRASGLWRATITHAGRQRSAGYHSTARAAARARKRVEKHLWNAAS